MTVAGKNRIMIFGPKYGGQWWDPGRLLTYIQYSERLVVVTSSLTGLFLVFPGQRWQVDLSPLPEWGRPTALVVWVISAAHVVGRTTMILTDGVIAAARFVSGIPSAEEKDGH
jgi:hypothetical protein